MPLAKPVETIRKELQGQLIEDIAGALKMLQGMLPENSEKYALVIALLGRLNDANKARLRNTLSNDDLQREYDKIRADLFDLIQSLEESDFDAAAAPAVGADGKPATRQGSILYRIPHVMPQGKETKCVVRIAMSEDAIVENITIDEHVQLKTLYRVSDTMQAELVDPTGGKVFDIRTINDPIQFIDEQGYTEWWFYVTPKETGSFPLVLKISIIEIIDGQPRHKELVMEEVVQVVTEGPAPEEEDKAPLKAAGYSLAFQGTATDISSSGGIRSATESSTRAKKAGKFPFMWVTAVAAATLTIVASVWVFTPADTREYWITQHIREDNAENYQQFMDQYPESRYYELAAFHKAELENTPLAFRDYLYEFPAGQFKARAELHLEHLEAESVAQFRQTPGPEGLKRFLINFPCSPFLDDILKIVENDSVLKKEYLPVVRNQIEECRHVEDLERFIDSTRIQGVTSPDTSGASPPDTPGVTPPPAPQKEPLLQKSPSTPTNPPLTKPAQREKIPEEPPASYPTQADTPAVSPRPGKERSESDKKPVSPTRRNMTLVKGGTFQMGSEIADEAPVRRITLSSFYLGKYEVTFEEYDKFCNATNRRKPDSNGWGRGKLPVIHVTWLDAVAYCNWLSEQDGLIPAYRIRGQVVDYSPRANGYRLPTEAEWEYAARGGAVQTNYPYSGSPDINEVAWYQVNSSSQIHPVGHKKPNALGIYDMSGNVREWCFDRYARYAGDNKTNPLGPPHPVVRVIRGGSWGRNPGQLRCTYRNKAEPTYEDHDTGFRIARNK